MNFFLVERIQLGSCMAETTLFVGDFMEVCLEEGRITRLSSCCPILTFF